MCIIYRIQSNVQIFSIIGVPKEEVRAESLLKGTLAKDFTNLRRDIDNPSL